MKNRIVFFMGLAIVISMLFVSFGDTSPTIYYNDVEIVISSNLGNQYIDKNGVTMVPLEGFMSYFGTEIEYVSNPEKVVITKNGNTLEFLVDETYFLKNGFKIETNSNIAKGDKDIYIPLRRVVEVMGERVVWNGENKSIDIKSNENFIAEVRKNIEPLSGLTTQVGLEENQLVFNWPKSSEVSYYFLYKIDENGKATRIGKPMFATNSSYYRPGYFDLAHYKDQAYLEFKVSSVVDGVESKLSQSIFVYTSK